MAGFYYIPRKYERAIIEAATNSLLESDAQSIYFEGAYEAFKTAYNNTKVIVGKLGTDDDSGNQVAVTTGFLSTNTNNPAGPTFGAIFDFKRFQIIITANPNYPDTLDVISIASA